MFGSPGQNARAAGRRPTVVRLEVEELEQRQAPAVLTPLQVHRAYGFDQVSFQVDGQTIRGDGRGQTIAIVTAFDHPRIFADMDVFSRQFTIDGQTTLYSQYGAARSFLTKALPQGRPRFEPHWALETALDVEWAHAIAPGARILLVEAASDSYRHLLRAVSYARSRPGVVAVSMSWGGWEFPEERTYDRSFRTPAGHLGGSDGRGGPRLPGGITVVASAGDTGAPADWPGVSPRVLSVGGTRLYVDDTGRYLGEIGWRDGGGGKSRYERRPGYQRFFFPNLTRRVTPDVAYAAEPRFGFYVYHSLRFQGHRGWFQLGGTSAGAPQWAALVAIANQGRALAGLGSLDGFSQTLPALYRLAHADFRDITRGNNGFTARVGFDLVTGRGSPRAEQIVSWLVRYGAPPATTTEEGSTAEPAPTGSADALARPHFWARFLGRKRPVSPPQLSRPSAPLPVLPPFLVGLLTKAPAFEVRAGLTGNHPNPDVRPLPKLIRSYVSFATARVENRGVETSRGITASSSLFAWAGSNWQADWIGLLAPSIQRI